MTRSGGVKKAGEGAKGARKGLKYPKLGARVVCVGRYPRALK